MIWGFFAVLFGSSIEAETIPWLLAGVIYFYLNYPGVRNHFVESEMSRLTPEQKKAMEDLAAANAAAAQAMAAPKAPPRPEHAGQLVTHERRPPSALAGGLLRFLQISPDRDDAVHPPGDVSLACLVQRRLAEMCRLPGRACRGPAHHSGVRERG